MIHLTLSRQMTEDEMASIAAAFTALCGPDSVVRLDGCGEGASGGPADSVDAPSSELSVPSANPTLPACALSRATDGSTLEP